MCINRFSYEPNRLQVPRFWLLMGMIGVSHSFILEVRSVQRILQLTIEKILFNSLKIWLDTFSHKYNMKELGRVRSNVRHMTSPLIIQISIILFKSQRVDEWNSLKLWLKKFQCTINLKNKYFFIIGIEIKIVISTWLIQNRETMFYMINITMFTL